MFHVENIFRSGITPLEGVAWGVVPQRLPLPLVMPLPTTVKHDDNPR